VKQGHTVPDLNLSPSATCYEALWTQFISSHSETGTEISQVCKCISQKKNAYRRWHTL